MSNLLWYKQNGNWINPNLFQKKTNYVEAIIYYKAKNKWVLLENITNKYQLDLNYISKCQDKESFIQLVQKSFPKSQIDTNIVDYQISDSGVYISNNSYNLNSSYNSGFEYLKVVIESNPVVFSLSSIKKPKYIDFGLNAYGGWNQGCVCGLSFIGNVSNTRYIIWGILKSTNYPNNYPDYYGYYMDNGNDFHFDPNYTTLYSDKIDISTLTHCFTDERDTEYSFEFFNTNGNCGVNNMYLNKLIFEY